MNESYVAFYSEEDGPMEIELIKILSKLPADDVPMINLPHPVKITISIALIAAILVGSYFKSVLYKGIFTSNKNLRTLDCIHYIRLSCMFCLIESI